MATNRRRRKDTAAVKQKKEERNAGRRWLPGMVPGYRDRARTEHVMYVPVLSSRSASSLYRGNQIAWHKFCLCTVMRANRARRNWPNRKKRELCGDKDHPVSYSFHGNVSRCSKTYSKAIRKVQVYALLVFFNEFTSDKNFNHPCSHGKPIARLK